MRRIYLLSPAHCGGKRAGLLMNREAGFELATRLRNEGAPLGEIFSFLSGLYFRGKLAYARAFAVPTFEAGGAWVITPNRGLLAPDTRVSLDELRALATTDIHPDDPAYRLPLERSCGALAATLAGEDRVILLGSIATDKYVAVLREMLGPRLLFPAEFVGRGDMSRGGLLLRCAREGRPLEYIPLEGATRRGKRPPRLER